MYTFHGTIIIILHITACLYIMIMYMYIILCCLHITHCIVDIISYSGVEKSAECKLHWLFDFHACIQTSINQHVAESATENFEISMVTLQSFRLDCIGPRSHLF